MILSPAPRVQRVTNPATLGLHRLHYLNTLPCFSPFLIESTACPCFLLPRCFSHIAILPCPSNFASFFLYVQSFSNFPPGFSISIYITCFSTLFSVYLPTAFLSSLFRCCSVSSPTRCSLELQVVPLLPDNISSFICPLYRVVFTRAPWPLARNHLHSI